MDSRLWLFGIPNNENLLNELFVYPEYIKEKKKKKKSYPVLFFIWLFIISLELMVF